MNIFSALAQGRGNLNEENMSAMLSFLLSFDKSHGLEDLFLRRFLENIREIKEDEQLFSDILDNEKNNVEVFLENPYEYKNKVKYVDIDLKLFSGNSFTHLKEEYRIIIENKIRPSSADPVQLKEQYIAVKNDIYNNETDNPEIIMIFIIPSGEYKKLKEEFESQKSTNINSKNMV